MKRLQRLVLEYQDGTQTRMELNGIDARVQLALAGAGLCEPTSVITEAKHYLVLRWKDGWQEVVAIHGDVAELLRYYVITRTEDRGRLALDTGSEYPELLVIERIPRDLSRLQIVSGGRIKSYDLQSELELYEGIFEAGGKREYLKYDRANPIFQDRSSEMSESPADIERAITAALNKEGTTAATILARDSDQRVREYEDIARAVGIRGLRTQSDVYGFIESVLKNMSGRDAARHSGLP